MGGIYKTDRVINALYPNCFGLLQKIITCPPLFGGAVIKIGIRSEWKHHVDHRGGSMTPRIHPRTPPENKRLLPQDGKRPRIGLGSAPARQKPRQSLEQFPDFLRIKSLHIFLFGADVDQTVVTPTRAFNGLGATRAAPGWKLLPLGLKHRRECQEFNCVSALGSPQPARDLTGRVASPVPRGACRPSDPEHDRYALRGEGGARRRGQTRCCHNELTSFVLLIIICHPRKHNKGYNHGYSERARRKRRPEVKPNLFTSGRKWRRIKTNISSSALLGIRNGRGPFIS